MAIEVIKPGLMTTIQDLGRVGFQQYGVIVSGAMDSVSLRMANILVGNKEDEGALEITLLGPTIKFLANAWISITGADLSATIDGKCAPLFKPIFVREQSVLTFGKREVGCRAYIAVQGGFSVPVVMNSKSTYLRAGIGGWTGRALKKGDKICFNTQINVPIGARDETFLTTNWLIDYQQFLTYSKEIRVTPGRQYSLFSEESIRNFSSQLYTIASQSDRMGYRMTGKHLALTTQVDLLSEAVTNGTVQVPPDGQPIILLADSQTTGGYPKIAQVISVDIPLVTQCIPGEKLSFQFVTQSEAEHLLLQRERKIKELKRIILFKQKEQQYFQSKMIHNK